MANTSNNNGWRPYDLDYYAQELVLEFRNTKDVLNESHKMRMTIAYGLERFWGEHLRLKGKEQKKSDYWKQVWEKLHSILDEAGIKLPNDNVNSTDDIKAMAKAIWSMPLADQRVALMVLTQLCDSLVWWTQRYKVKGD
ncbi:hypothetical protein [Pseudanabaena mucicola]|uniref:hypothetical protein n=1 Tax=Pseudanabaena mucicola TaxID=71190 RepID=UPI00257907FA|nr:hypothetical protein [Pseudanabaena mucicola]